MGALSDFGALALVVLGLVLGPVFASVLTYHLMRRGLPEGRAVAIGVVLGLLLVLAVLAATSDLPGWLEVIPLIGLPLIGTALVLNFLHLRGKVKKAGD